MDKNMKSNKAITLIALIITIIILVILAAVSIRAVYNMGIVNYAVNGTGDYAKAAKTENELMSNTENYISDIVGSVRDAVENAGEDTKPPVVTIQRKANTTFDWTASDNVGVVGYVITTTPNEPTDG